MSIREFKTERRIQIAFSFRGVECRELEPPGPITQAALTRAAGKRAEVLRRIEDRAFVYADYFPDSPRARQFGASGTRVLIGKLLDAQQEIYEQQATNKQISPSTLDGYVKAMTSKRMEFWRDKTLSAATPSALRAWIAELGTTAKFTRNLLTPLRSVFEDALNDDLIQFDPFDRISLTKLLKQHAKTSDYVVDPYTAAEREELLQACRPDEVNMVRFWFATGLRPGELIALRWPKVDLARRTARIDVNRVAKVDKLPKTEAGIRVLELDASALAALTAQKAATFLAGEHVWHNPREGMAWETDAQIRRTLWIPLHARAKVRYRNPYQARHTFASAHLTAGANPWWLAQQMGHVDVQMVFRTYGKFIAEDFQKPKVAKLAVVGGREE